MTTTWRLDDDHVWTNRAQIWSNLKLQALGWWESGQSIILRRCCLHTFVEIVWKNSYRSVVICCNWSEARDHEICLRTWSCKDKDGQIAQWIFPGHFRQDEMGRSHMLEQSQSIWCSSECGVPMESFSLCSQLGRHTNEVATSFFCFDVLIWNYIAYNSL